MMFGLGMQAQAIFDGIEELCSKRDELNRQIQQEEEEKGHLQHDIRVLTEKLRRVNESLVRRHSVRTDFDHTIGETEGAFMKNTGWNYLQQFQTANIPRVILISNSLGVTKSIIAEQTNAHSGELSNTAECNKEGSRKSRQSH
ncbi:microtubule nucleation factor SSNA1-like isoform X2 [Oncorhynchus keta]|uniref:microtubule nucleation factor SSNA1-like isoform X2 n=1 Tax=Oncorhynchus keta TaxID=8018 RepID=UPI0015FDA730|nr:microtubule nucleation factor SSNA1-like isoform X2 [Oncorhynchus keta]